MTTFENKMKAELIKKALTVVDELAELDIDDTDELGDLILRAEKLKNDVRWKL
jgi:hypothetical protein